MPGRLVDLLRPIALAATLGVASCASPQLSSQIESGQAAYSTFEAPAKAASQRDYRIGALDAIDVNIYQEPDLSQKALEVDANGNVSLPLIGTVAAAGKTTSELSHDIASRLNEHYLKDPQVAVTVATSASQKVTVEGEVAQPGVYDIKGGTSLLQTLALAKGETRTAKLNQVVIFRTINGQRMGAVFDVGAIRTGKAEDPDVLGNDVVVVGFSQARRTWTDILQSVPMMGLFRVLPFVP
jgi:polysaccharide biosynthesis/export protein